MRVLLLNQAFYPDVVASAQLGADLAARLVEEGHAVTVLTSSRGYDDPRARFPRRQVWKGVEIRRVPCLGLGKTTKWRRALNFGSFLISCMLRLLVLRGHDVVLAMTSPPLISFPAALFSRCKGGCFVSWVLDLNPDQAVAAGWLRGRSVAARLLDHMLLWSFRRASRIVVLDRHMSRRVRSKGVPEEKIVVIPPWAQDESVSYDPAGRQEFREAHGLSDKYVVMYAGNHSPCHPLDTLLEAAARLAAHPKVAFCFLGGGSEFEKVRHFAQRHGVGNILCLPYQPLERLSRSLSAADLHVVVMGQGFAGIVHTCKIYNVLALGIPFLYIGPAESHVTDLISTAAVNGNARVAAHGDADAVTRCILAGAGSRPASPSIEEMRVAEGFSQGVLTGRMVETLEAAGAPERARSAACSRSTAVAG